MINCAIIGMGHIGKRHAKHILENVATNLVAFCDIDVNTKSTFPNIPFYTKVEELLAQPSIEVICICTPNYLHCAHTVAALNAGYHTIVEKPMALSKQECDEMIAAADVVGKQIFAVKQNRYNPPVASLRKIISEGKLGKTFLVQVNCFWNRNAAYYAQSDWRGKKAKDGGCLFTQFSHFVDIMYYLNGGIATAKGQIDCYTHKENTEFEDTGSFVMKAENGSIVNFNFSTCAHHQNMEGSITMLAEKGTVKVGGQYLNTVEYQNIEDIILPEEEIAQRANDYGTYQGSMSNHDAVIENMVQVLRHNQPVMTSAAEGKKVVEIIELMYACVNLPTAD